jgi:ABC-type Na+ efflux pump permease subunit
LNVLRAALFIARKDLQLMLRARETLLWVFVMPLVFFYFIGTITSGFGGMPSSDRKDPLALVDGQDGGFLLDQLVRRLEEQDYAVARPAAAEELGARSRRIIVPPAFTDSVLAGVPVKVQFGHDTEGIASEYESIRAARAVYTLLADVVVSGETGAGPTEESIARLNEMPRAVTLDVKPAGRRRRIPSGFEQAIPGIMVMFALLVMTSSGAVLLVIERNQGLLRRLAYTPIPRRAVVLGKWGGKLAVGVVQIAFAMLAGTLIFKMDWGPDLGAVVVVLLVYGALTAALGVLLGSLARTEGQAAGIGVISSIVLAALGGCWWPIEITPSWMQTAQLFLPTGWAMNAMHKLISFGAGPASVLPHVVGMAVAVVVLMAVSTRTFRFE